MGRMLRLPRRHGRTAEHRAGATRRRALWALLVAAALAVTACDDEAPRSPGSPDAQSTAAGLTLSGSWPLTGLAATGASPRHPVMVVKIDNSVSSSPQLGLSHADLVTEELVEGGSTRLAAFYYQHVPRRVGPVRSMRATDIGIVRPADAVLVAAGGAPPTVKRIRAAKIKTYGEGAPGFARDTSRIAPYNLFVDLSKLARTVKADRTPGSYLPWGSGKDLPKGQPARGLSAVFSGAHTTTWRFADGRYTNLNTFAAKGDEFRPETVLVLRVRVGDAGYLDPAGNPVPETRFTGTGKALVFHDGRLVRGTWKKKLDSPIRLSTGSGDLRLPPGHVWIELVPVSGRVSVTN